jgi:hypothetical protein
VRGDGPAGIAVASTTRAAFSLPHLPMRLNVATLRYIVPECGAS